MYIVIAIYKSYVHVYEGTNAGRFCKGILAQFLPCRDYIWKVVGSNATMGNTFLFCNSPLLRVPCISTKPIQMKSSIINT